MLPEGSIEARHIWKRFHADKRYRSVRDVVARLGRTRRVQRNRYRWALRDVDFVVRPGESVGLIGPNGSGKSTLLKILARVMYPYGGTISVCGRVGALIEVRAGLHPELTGGENLFLFGSMLGLPRKLVAARFDEIMEFADLTEATDRQVKFYSSGMQMRLGFAVAAFLEPSILLVDEVLAVGDATFQQRCLDRINHVLSQGTTCVFVSHDLAAVEATCARGIWLQQGVVREDGPIREVLSSYRRSIEEQAESAPQSSAAGRIVRTTVHGPDEGSPRTSEPMRVETWLELQEARNAVVCIGVSEGPGLAVFLVRRDLWFEAGENKLTCVIDHLPLPRGRFYIWLALFDARGREMLPWHPAAKFDVIGPDLDKAPRAVVRPAPVHVDATWTANGETRGTRRETSLSQGG